MTVTISVDEAVCVWSKFCGFLTPYRSAGGTKLSLKMLILRLPFVFILFRGDGCGRKKHRLDGLSDDDGLGKGAFSLEPLSFA